MQTATASSEDAATPSKSGRRRKRNEICGGELQDDSANYMPRRTKECELHNLQIQGGGGPG